MKKLLLTILPFFLALSLSAQKELVANPGFEDGNFDGNKTYEVRGGGSPLKLWYSPTKNTPFLFRKPERSVAKAQNGDNAIGLILGSGKQEKTKYEYITGKLSEPMKKGQMYCVSFSTILQRSSRWVGTNIGLLFHHDAKTVQQVADPKTLAASLYANGGGPVSNTNWQNYNGYYLASGGEQYVSIGKFGTLESIRIEDLGFEPYIELDGFQNKAFYQFDDVSVKEMSDTVDCGCASNDPKLDTTSTERKLQPFLFALDRSASMRKNDLFNKLRVSLVELLTILPKGTPISLVSFSSGALPLYFGKVDEKTPALVDSLLIRRGLSGGTNVFSGLKMAYEGLPTSVPDSARMVLISDGAFSVTKQIEGIVKREFEENGRKLTVVQIEAKAKGMEKLEPYQVNYINTTPSELSQTVSQLYQHENKGMGEAATTCECVEEYSDTINYHFVLDYSGSMRQEKGRVVSAVTYLFERAPDNAIISLTSFNTTADQLYVGRKADISMQELERILRRERTGGGTNPVPGVRHGLSIAKRMSPGRFSNLILITDYTATNLNKIPELRNICRVNMDDFPLAVGSIKVSAAGVVIHSQFDGTTQNFLTVPKDKFEEDLFYGTRSSCDYTTQPYHYNPAKAYLKKEGKRFLQQAMKDMIMIKL